jgi:hypothetical protein
MGVLVGISISMGVRVGRRVGVPVGGCVVVGWGDAVSVREDGRRARERTTTSAITLRMITLVIARIARMSRCLPDMVRFLPVVRD